MSAPPIPKLPGYSVYVPQALGDKKFAKNQTLTFLKGYQREEAPRVVGEVPPPQPLGETYPPLQASDLQSLTTSLTEKFPRWVENDRKVLRFYGYFKESVVESNMENHRIRKVILYYYLEDDSMHVAEPRQDNSGIPQGVFIKRHKIPREDGSFFSPVDFSVGNNVTMYGRTFYLVDCDRFTRDFYNTNLGKEQSERLPYPDDPVDSYRRTFGLNRGTGVQDSLDDFLASKTGRLPGDDKLRKYLENNRKVLRFWCIWDDRQNMYGDRRPYVIHYYLEDDSVEVLDVNENNSGRDPFPVFLRRGPLPKSLPNCLTATMGTTNRKAAFFKPEDFRMGTYVNILNRDFFIHDCDSFTRTWYTDNMGYTDAEMRTVDVTEPIIPLPKPALAPYNGYGTLEDSLQNCLSLIPKPPKKDMHKLMNKDKIILRFICRMQDGKARLSHADRDRRFILSYFMMDDTLQIFEPPVRNSGIVGGKFLERQKVFKPSSEETYTYLDLFVGGVIEVFNRRFELLEADEYTLTYMEHNKHVFIMADTDAILRSLRAQISGKEDAIRTAFIEMDSNGSGYVSSEELETALANAGFRFTKHQSIALKRRLDKDRSGSISIAEFLSALGVTSQ